MRVQNASLPLCCKSFLLLDPLSSLLLRSDCLQGFFFFYRQGTLWPTSLPGPSLLFFFLHLRACGEKPMSFPPSLHCSFFFPPPRSCGFTWTHHLLRRFYPLFTVSPQVGAVTFQLASDFLTPRFFGVISQQYEFACTCFFPVVYPSVVFVSTGTRYVQILMSGFFYCGGVLFCGVLGIVLVFWCCSCDSLPL